MKTSRAPLLALVAAALLAAACSPSDGGSPATSSTSDASASTVATTATTTVLPTLPPEPFVTAYPDVRAATFPLGPGDEPFRTRPLEEVLLGATGDSVPTVAFTDRYVFQPSATDLTQPGPVRFINESDREVEITFGVDSYESLTLAPGEQAEIAVQDTEDGLLRFETIVGRSRPVGNIEVVDTSPLPDDLLEAAGLQTFLDPFEITDRTGSLFMAMPETAFWRENRGYLSFTLSPESTAIPQGSLASAFVNGFTPFEPGLRVDASSQDTLETAQLRLNGATPPPGCGETAGSAAGSESVASSRSFECGAFTVEIGFVELGDGVAYFAASEPPDAPFGFVEALSTLTIHDAGTYADLDEMQPPLWAFDGTWGGPEAVNLDITEGRFAPPSITYRYTYEAADEVTIRNFDAETRRIYVDGRPFVELEAGRGVTFSVDAFDSWPLVVAVGADPWARLDVFLETTMRHPRDSVEMSALFDPVELVPSEEAFLSAAFSLVSEELVPVDWDRSDNLLGYRYERNGDELDVASFTREVYSWDVTRAVREISFEQRGDPDLREFSGVRYFEWATPGDKTVSMFILPLDEIVDRPGSITGIVYVLESAPEEHEYLFENLLARAVFEARINRVLPGP